MNTVVDSLPLAIAFLGVFIAILLIFSSVKIISQGNVGVIEWFGSYKRILRPGLNFIVPVVERVSRRISTQNQSNELTFQAITQDQANVKFSAMILYSVLNDTEDTIQLVAYKFISSDAFASALTRTIEGSIRSLVAGKKQSEVLGMRGEIVEYVKSHLDATLNSWGYHLNDLQINDITFDEEITTSMTRVVAAKNALTAADAEGEAKKIVAVKSAEADGDAARIRAKAIADSRKILNASMKDLDPKVIAMMNLDVYCDTLKEIALNGEGKIVFVDPTGNSFASLVDNMHTISNGQN